MSHDHDHHLTTTTPPPSLDEVSRTTEEGATAATVSATFTPRDVEDYLDSLTDDDAPVGITCSGGNCLLARAAKRCFPHRYVCVYGEQVTLSMPIGLEQQQEEASSLFFKDVDIMLPDMLVAMYQHFDALGGEGWDGVDRIITKREWLAHWQGVVARTPTLQQYYDTSGRLLLQDTSTREEEKEGAA